MAKTAKMKQAKLPKKLLGVKIPKKTRRSINTLLKDIPGNVAMPLLSAAVGAVLNGIVNRLEGLMPEAAKPGPDRSENAPHIPKRPDMVRH